MAHVTLETAFEIPDAVVFRELDGEAVLLNLDSGQYFGLNAVGTRIWQLLAEAKRPQPIIDALLAEYEVSHAELESDVLALLGQLADRGLIAAVP
ncbi:MAG TPA: PqqD family peptide modification chaperone [Vicinamibacterales bacterium]